MLIRDAAEMDGTHMNPNLRWALCVVGCAIILSVVLFEIISLST